MATAVYRNTFATNWPAFYLGSVAPDVNAISAIPREGTHFYGMPPAGEEMAYPTMLAKYPQLTNLTTMLGGSGALCSSVQRAPYA